MVIGMTNHTEARLAREAEIAYASLAMATDYDCWHPDHGNVTVEIVLSNLRENAHLASRIVAETAKKVAKIRPSSSAHTALKHGLMTSQERINAKTRKKIDLFTTPYWGPYADKA